MGSYYVAFPAESLEILSDAWAVDLHAKGSDDAFALARNLMAVAAIYLAVWGLTCCALAWVGSPSAKRIVAALNLVAALLVAACSARVRRAGASFDTSRRRRGRRPGIVRGDADADADIRRRRAAATPRPRPG